MKDETLNKAVENAKRFIAAAEVTEEVVVYNGRGFTTTTGRTGKINASIKRASMDLTRTLANLRGGK